MNLCFVVVLNFFKCFVVVLCFEIYWEKEMRVREIRVREEKNK
jgi:hypothetical protein